MCRFSISVSSFDGHISTCFSFNEENSHTSAVFVSLSAEEAQKSTLLIKWLLQVTFASACSFIVLVSTVFHYMFRPTWPSSSV
jgi:hypothetical protein